MSRYLFFTLCCTLPLFAGIDLRVEPGRERVRPHDSAAILVRFTGTDRPAGPSLPEGISLRIASKEGGWLSKPFRYSTDDGSRTVAVLYTAPGRPGRYAIEGRYKAVHLQVEVAVIASAPASRPVDSVSFGPESAARDFYRDLAEHYAPFICQETWFEPKADFPIRFDFDGDWRGDNNWDNLGVGSSQAYVYYAAMETSTHYFLVYDFFYARRYSDDCSAGACQENDSTGLVLTIRKDGSKYGRPQLMETVTRNGVYSYSSDARLRDGAHRIAGDIRFWRDSHPMLFVESGSHSVFAASDPHSRYSTERGEFIGGTGVTYRFGGTAARPAHANDREVSYELLSAHNHWWSRATPRQDADAIFGAFFRYSPSGNRPHASADEIPGAFVGRKYAANQARPFWAWSDPIAVSRKVLAPGQWGLDPAYAAAVCFKYPAGSPLSLDYIHNPYLASTPRRESISALPTSLNSGGGRIVADPGPRVPGIAPAPGGERHVLSPPAEKPNYKLKDKHGQLEFRARVDGTVYLYIRGDQIEVEYLSGRPMDEIRYRFSQPLPAAEMEDVKLDDIEGRGSVRLLEWPNAGNQFTAKVRVIDDKPGAAVYKFRLGWKR